MNTLPPLAISEKQRYGIELARKHKYQLFSGPRRSTKTTCAELALCDHAWRVENAQIAVVAISQSSAVEAGVWTELTEVTFPQYMALPGQRMEWHREPFNSHNTKKPTCEVTNQYGGIATIHLDSLKNEAEAEARFKGKNYSMLYVAELSNFRRRKTFDVWCECLRGRLWKDEDFLFLADTNPSDEGDQSWIYQVFWTLRQMSDEQVIQQFGKHEGKSLLVLKRRLSVLEFELADNIFESQDAIQEVIGRYLHDPDLYARYVLGKWVSASPDALFAQVFRESRHVVGEIQTAANPEPEMLAPQSDCWELITGWDPGTSSNSAAVIIEKWWKKVVTPKGTSEVLVFKILDELVVLDADHTLVDFVIAFQEKMRWWDEFCGKSFGWKHWSDRMVFDVKEPRENLMYAQIITMASGGEIEVQAAGRGQNSVRQRVDLFRRLLFEDRILINRDFCPYTIEMCKSLKRAKPEFKTGSEVPAIARGARGKHVFDAIMYAIASEAVNEMENSLIENYVRRTTPSESGVVMVPA